MDYVIISRDNYGEFNFAQISAIHYDALSYRSVIALYGENFLAEVYKIIVSSGIGFLVVAKESNVVIGFTCGILDNSRLMRVLALSWYRLISKMIVAICKRPMLIIKTIEMMQYANNFSKLNSEMLSIAVKKQFRSNNVGGTLIARLEKEFAAKNIGSYQVTVHSVMEESNNFYYKNGMKIDRKFTLFDTEWNLLIKDIKKENK